MKLSIIIPTYNNEETIKRCLDSIPKKKDMEIIVINDASTDNTSKILKQYKDIIVLNNKKNKGVSYSRNKGIDEAQGDYILFIDADDYIYSEDFNYIYDNELGFVDLVFYDMEDNKGNKYIVNKFRVQNRVGCFKYIKSSFIDDLRFDESLSYGEDQLFHAKLMKKNPTFRCTGRLLYHYNYPREGSITWRHNHENKNTNN